MFHSITSKNLDTVAESKAKAEKKRKKKRRRKDKGRETKKNLVN